ncbi:MAG: hypothetical protein H7Y42_17925 [Chitinophagaceae bacterium]|nr:hypothetical protein [Chitinophagaceae bacterium]
MANSKMTIVIIGVAIIVIAVLVFIRNKPRNQGPIPKETVDQTVPDFPVGFGYKCMWFAVKTSDQQKIVTLFKIKNSSKCNWKVGIDKAYTGSVFITPTIDGWTLACGLGLSTGESKEGIDEVKQILRILSKEFGEAQFFCTQRVVEYHCWIRATTGQVTRVYSYLGEQGENIAIEGEPTEIEKQYRLVNTFSDEAKDEKYFGNKDLVTPDEEFIMKVAEHWSIDPTQLGNRKDLPLSLGLIGQR